MERGLFLDLDGTLADSHAMLARAYARFAERVGASDAPAFTQAAAMTLPQIVDRLTDGREDLDRAALLEEYEQGVLEDYAEVPARDGAMALLRWARTAGLRTAVVTSARESLSRRWLEARGLWSLLDALVGREGAAHSKPHPDPYLEALARCGCDATQSVAVEDSRTGATSALAAGLTTYALASPADGWPPVAGFLDDLLQVREKMAL